MITSRLKLYAQCQKKNSIRLKLDSLRRGESPSLLVDTAPDQIQEQQMKIRMLAKELQELVAQRKELSGARGAKQAIARRERRVQHEMARKIQRVWRAARERWRARKHPVREPPPREVPAESEVEKGEATAEERPGKEEEATEIEAEETAPVGKVEDGEKQLEVVEEEERKGEVAKEDGNGEVAVTVTVTEVVKEAGEEGDGDGDQPMMTLDRAEGDS
jgi:hypothetical protein